MTRLNRQHAPWIKHFLAPLSPEDLITVGMQLGISPAILKAMSPESRLDGMVDKWLEKWSKGVVEGTNETCMHKLTSALDSTDHKDIVADMFEG